MRSKFVRTLLAIVATLSLTIPAVGSANAIQETPSALAMTGDALIARPALLAMTVVGSVVYLVSLPFSALGGNAGEAADVLVVGPAKATFVRCLGCSMSGRKLEKVTEQEES
ncbi:hypothetical protein [Alkalimarinus coralli]|uniref:hypothetical protein n=1 Tax=Alkalimarinus coralli TaxID=2935863 RepID=UPI00202B5A3A|nr:hypothetical protein [Alkalimarinus coralli]